MIKKYYFQLIVLSLLFNYNMKAQDSLVIFNAGSVIMSGGNIFIEDGRFINDGTFTATDGTVHMTGSDISANTSIGGSVETSFHNLTINKSMNDVFLEQNITVVNTLDLSSGLFDLQSFNTRVDGTIINPTATSYVWTSGMGTLKMNVGTTPSVMYPLGSGGTYTPMTINNTGTDDEYSMRVESIVRSEGLTGVTQSDNIVNKTWHIDETTIGGSNLTLTAQWNTTDEVLFDRNNCYISHYTSFNWDLYTAAVATGTDPYSISRTGITNLSPFTVTSSIVPLPLDLISFEATKVEKSAFLEWKTENEYNSSHFEIERSFDGDQFNYVGELRASNVIEGDEYDFYVDNNAPGNNYYRLKIVDFDGSYEYSDIRVLHFDQKGVFIGEFFPNPAEDGFAKIQFVSLENTEARLDIFDVSGKFLFTRSEIIPEGHSYIKLIIPPYEETHLFFVRITMANNKTYFRKFLMSN